MPFQVVSGHKVDFSGTVDGDAAAGVRRTNTVGTAYRRHRHATDAAYYDPTHDPFSPPRDVSPLYDHLDQTLQRHTSLPSRVKADAYSPPGRSHSGMSSLQEQLFYDAQDEISPSSSPGPPHHHNHPSNGQHHRSVSNAGSSGSSASPASPRTDNGVFLSGAFASSVSSAAAAAAGVRRHQSLNLHRQRQPSIDYGPIGSPGSSRGYVASGRPRVTSVGEGHSAAAVQRNPWSPTPAEAAQLYVRRDGPAGSDGSHSGSHNSQQHSPTIEEQPVEERLASLHVDTDDPDDLTQHAASAAAGDADEARWTNGPMMQPLSQPVRRNTPQLSPLVTDFRGGGSPAGPATASASVPWIGQTHASAPRDATHISPVNHVNHKGHTAAPGVGADIWYREKDRMAGPHARSQLPSNGYDNGGFPTLGQAAAFGGQGLQSFYAGDHVQTAALLQQQQLQIQQLQAQVANARHQSPWPMGPQASLHAAAQSWSGGAFPSQHAAGLLQQHQKQTGLNGAGRSPIDVQAFAQSKGFNPPPHLVDLQPTNARFFVIKSYTEEDVHKSIKYSIWTSTALGNKRLDKAFRENADFGKIFLFFSVNSSGHFCGVAEMLTPVDETIDATVWAQSKWKGVLKVRWIYIRDVPNGALRHIRLSNTPEAKPVTSSRDTQEVPYDAGLEILRLFSTYQSKTSLLQDYAWYENLTAQRHLQAALVSAGLPPQMNGSALPPPVPSATFTSGHPKRTAV